MWKIAAVTIAFFAVIGTVCSPAAGQGTKKDTLWVHVDMNSGRPNPYFMVTDSTSIAVIRSMCGNLATVSEKEKDQIPIRTINKLGYRGFVCTNVTGIAFLPKTFRVFKSDVLFAKDSIGSDGTTITDRQYLARLQGKGKSLEEWLLSRAKSENVISEVAFERIHEVLK